MKPLLCLVLIIATLAFAGCTKNVMVPTPPDAAPIIAAIAASDIPPDKKPAAIEAALSEVRKMYEEQVRRAREMGENIKLSWQDFLKQAVYVGGVVWATK